MLRHLMSDASATLRVVRQPKGRNAGDKVACVKACSIDDGLDTRIKMVTRRGVKHGEALIIGNPNSVQYLAESTARREAHPTWRQAFLTRPQHRCTPLQLLQPGKHLSPFRVKRWAQIVEQARWVNPATLFLAEQDCEVGNSED